MNRLLVSFMATALTACTSLPHTPSNRLPESLLSLAKAPSLACRYEKQVEGGTQQSPSSEWFFWRDEQRTETRDAAIHQGEIWERNAKGQLTHTEIFFDERITLEYNSVDLLTSGIEPRWQQLWSLVDPQSLGQTLKLEATREEAGLKNEHYAGIEDGITVALDWLPQLQLPARIEKRAGQAGFSLKLTACHTRQEAPWKPLSKQAFDQFRHLEYSDLGDMESDPQVRRILARMGHVHAEGGN